MAPQLNEKGWITRSNIDRQARMFCRCTVRTSRWSWINERSNNLLRYHCALSAQCADRCNPMW